MKQVTDADLYESIVDSDKPLVIVDYWAPWCAPCIQVGKLLEVIETEQPLVEVLKINIDDNPKAAFGKTSIPVIEFYLNGRFQYQKVGSLTRRQLTQLVDSFLTNRVE